MVRESHTTSRRKTACGLFCLGVLLCLGFGSPVSGQFGQFIAPQGTADDSAEEDATTMEGSPLNVDRRLKSALKLAEEQYIAGEITDALDIWQGVLTRANNTLTTKDEWDAKLSDPEREYQVYRSITDEIERRLAKLPPAELRMYRQTYDADAGLVLKLKANTEREAVLEEVVDHYFISSLGDDSAYYLAMLWFDQGDYARSARILQKILTAYPDSNISPRQLRLRLALACVRMRDLPSARKYWDEYQELSDGSVPDAIQRMFQQELARATKPPAAKGISKASWPMRYGGASRNHDMPALPPNAMEEKLSETWSQNFDTQLEQTKATNTNRRTVIFAGGFRTTSGSQVQHKPLDQEWRDNGWMPARQLCFDRGRLYINGNSRVYCFDAEEGRVLWKGRQYQYEPDPLLRTYANLFRNNNLNGKRQPSTGPEIQLFGDRLHPLVTVHDDTVYAIEGQLLDWGVKPNEASLNNTSVVLGRHRSRKNWMAAYDAITGKLKWHRPAGEPAQTGTEIPVGFLAAPVPFGDNLLVPVSNKGELWVHSLRQDTGETVWKVFLRDEPVEGVSPWSAVGTAIEGGDLYLSTGMGYVFAMDAATGKVHWAVNYSRQAAFPTANIRGFNAAMVMNAASNGWTDDLVIPNGNQLVVLPSDYDRIVTLDRRNGALLWDASQVPFDGDPQANYCIGVSGEDLYVGSREVIRKYHIPTGYLKWEQFIENSLGQAALTSAGVYVPTANSILKLDNETGKVVARAEVYSPTGEPVGNLVSDGRHLYGVGLQRIYALASLSDRLELLAKKIDDGDGEAQLTRMRIHMRRDNRVAAIADLEAAVSKLRARQGLWRSWEALNNALEELKLPESEPEIALRLLVQSRKLAEEPESPDAAKYQAEEQQAIEFDRTQRIYTALEAMQEQKKAEALDVVLSASTICDSPQLELQAIRTVAALADPEDRPQLEKALKSPAVPTRLAAVEALLTLFPDDAQTFAQMLREDANDRLQLKGAKVAANLGDRDILPVLCDLLESDDLGVRVQAASILRAFTQQSFRFTAYDDPESRQAVVAKWRKWIETDGPTAMLVYPLQFGPETRGRMLYTNYSQNSLHEVDEKGKEVWSKTGVSRPYACQGLENGHRLVTSYGSKSVHEFDEAGKEVWKKDDLPGYPFSVQRLPNGNTLIGCSDNRSSHRVIEYTPAGKIAWEKTLAGSPRSARRLDNGNTLVAIYNQHEVVELDFQGNVVWRASNMNSPIMAQRLPNGHTVIAQYSTRRIVELDAKKNTVWAKQWNSTLYDVQRLSNGNTLIVDTSGIKEIDVDGKIVSQKLQSGIRGVSRY